jgi:hypothetical protein
VKDDQLSKIELALVDFLMACAEADFDQRTVITLPNRQDYIKLTNFLATANNPIFEADDDGRSVSCEGLTITTVFTGGEDGRQ